MSIDVTITDNSSEIMEALEENADRTLEMLGLQAAGYAALELESDPRRIDTGLLRNSITYAIAGESPAKTSYQADRGDGEGRYQGKIPRGFGEKAVYIGSNVEYAIYVHEGFHLPSGAKVDANRFLRNAVTKHTDEYARMIEKGMRGQL